MPISQNLRVAQWVPPGAVVNGQGVVVTDATTTPPTTALQTVSTALLLASDANVTGDWRFDRTQFFGYTAQEVIDIKANGTNAGYQGSTDALHWRTRIRSHALDANVDLSLQRVNGSFAAPTYLTNSQVIGDITFRAGAPSGMRQSALIRSVSTEAHTATNGGTGLDIYSTPNATVSPRRVMQLNAQLMLIETPTYSKGFARWTGWQSTLSSDASGPGVELGYVATGTPASLLMSYDRTGGAYQPLSVQGSWIALGSNGSPTFTGYTGTEVAQIVANSGSLILEADDALHADARLKVSRIGDVPGLHLQRINGAYTAATAIQSAQDIGAIFFKGSRPNGVMAHGAAIYASATETWTDTSTPSQIQLFATPSGSTGTSRVARFSDSQITLERGVTVTKAASVTDPSLRVSSTFPWMELVETDAAHADMQRWAHYASGGQYIFAGVSAAGGIGNVFLVNRNTNSHLTKNVFFPTATGGSFVLGQTSPSSAFGNRLFHCIATNAGVGNGGAGAFIVDSDGMDCVDCWSTAASGNNVFVGFYTDPATIARANILYDRGAGQVRFNQISDARLKENIEDAADAGSIVDAIRVRQFDWIEAGHDHIRYGFIAQELYEAFPPAATPGDDERQPPAPWGTDPTALIPLLVKELQSLRARVAALE